MNAGLLGSLEHRVGAVNYLPKLAILRVAFSDVWVSLMFQHWQWQNLLSSVMAPSE